MVDQTFPPSLAPRPIGFAVELLSIDEDPFDLLVEPPKVRQRFESHSHKALREECDMIGVFVTFRYGDDFNEQTVRKIAATARVRFEGMPGLRSKAFTFNPGKREATNFYIWDSENAAKAFFTDELLERVTGLYGVRPGVEFVQIAALVENGVNAS
jgi:hypothetical protein